MPGNSEKAFQIHRKSAAWMHKVWPNYYRRSMTDSKIARTGRVQSWIDDPTELLPVSCTVDVVKDQMWGERSITDSWHFTTHGLQKGAGVAVHLSELRPSGTDNGRGLVASGPVPFMPVWSDINGAVRKGGRYKNGAVVLHLDLSHPDVLEFITLDRKAINYAKRAHQHQPDPLGPCNAGG